MSEQFAKLFESAKYGQLLVKLDADPQDDKPELRVYFKPDGLGVCSAAIGFKDTDKGWDLAEKAFESADIALAERIAQSIAEAIG